MLKIKKKTLKSEVSMSKIKNYRKLPLQNRSANRYAPLHQFFGLAATAPLRYTIFLERPLTAPLRYTFFRADFEPWLGLA